MGLAFLNKKSWHTGSFQNIEKVWIAENRKKEDDKRNAERAKKLKEERQNEELKKLQVEAGLLPASVLDRQEWIYEWGNKVQDQSKEDYLLGKAVTQTQDKERDNRKYPFTPLLKEGFANAQNEAFVKLHEDPLFMIKQEEMKRRSEIINNPLKMREIYKEIEGKSDKKKSKKSKKEKKERKEKKEKKEKKKKRDRSKDRSRERSHSGDRHRHKKSSKRRHDSASRSRSRSNASSSRSRSRSHEKRHKEHKEVERHHSSNSSKTTSSSLFNEYLKKKLGPNVSINQDTFKPDFNINRRKKKEHMSHEDRMKMVDEMKQNADDLSKMKFESNKEIADDHAKEKDGSTFIQKMRTDVYSKDSGVNDLGDRMARNVHYYAKGSDDTKNSYRR